eukprot:1146395-Pelagomonas_calceolata.AAC.4
MCEVVAFAQRIGLTWLTRANSPLFQQANVYLLYAVIKGSLHCSIHAQVIAELQEGLEGFDSNNWWQDQGIIEQVTQNPQLKWAY